MRSKKEVKEYLDELKEQYSEWDQLSEPSEDIDAEEAQIIEIQIETLEWVLS